MTRKRSYLAGAASLSLALAACNGSSRTATDTQAPAGPQPAVTQAELVGAAACTDGVTLRLVGVNPGNVSSLVLQLGSIAMRRTSGTGGDFLASNAADWPLDVSTDAVTHDIGTLWFSTNELFVDVEVFFSGGTASLGGASGAIDACTSPLTFPLDPSRLAGMGSNCLFEIALDVGRSVVPIEGGLAFLPQLRVLFGEKP